jgi:anhydro-N-acetylmuramic acid kinase
MLEHIRLKETRRVVGLMSGTSVDGIDGALVEITGDPLDGKVKLIAFENNPFPEEVKEMIISLFDTKHANIEQLGYMNVLLGELYAKAVFSVVHKVGLKIEDVDFIGSHGQTIFHHPEVCTFPIQSNGYSSNSPKGSCSFAYTMQIGEGAVIAARTGIPCVSDFRVADMAAGGQGAPLVPFTEYLLYKREDKTVLLQNIGGIGNITVLPKGGSQDEVYAFDTGPGNMIMDGLISLFTNGEKSYDEGGKRAAKGQVNKELLDTMCRDSYFSKKPPKSTGRELFGKEYCMKLFQKMLEQNISMEDALATVTEFTAWSIEDSYRQFIMEKEGKRSNDFQFIIGGGGSYNHTLVTKIKHRMEPLGMEVLIQEDIGFSSDAKEAVAFAMLADCTIAGKYNNIPTVTGACKPVVMGKISL